MGQNYKHKILYKTGTNANKNKQKIRGKQKNTKINKRTMIDTMTS